MSNNAAVVPSLSDVADAACVSIVNHERDEAAGHPGKLLAAARRLKECQAALITLAKQEKEDVARAEALLEGAREKEARSRAEAEAAQRRGDPALAKSLRRTARRAVETRQRAEGLLSHAGQRLVACSTLAQLLGTRAEELDAEGQEALATRCSAMLGMTIRVDVQSIRRAGGAAWGPPMVTPGDRQEQATSSSKAGARVESIGAEARALAAELLRQVLGAEDHPADIEPRPALPADTESTDVNMEAA